MKVALLTYSRAPNCGAILQAWAMRRVLEDMGHTVAVPSVREYEDQGRICVFKRAIRNGFVEFLRECAYQFFTLGMKEWLEWRFRKSIEKIFPPLWKSVGELSEYDLMIVGSDQVWNPAMGEYKLPLYLCECLPSKIPAIGYAVSSGDRVPDRLWDDRFDKAVRRFSFVTVREQATQEFLQRASGVRCEQVLDPSLLLTLDDYLPIEEGEVPKDPYVLFYVLGTNDVLKMVPQLLRAAGVKHAVYVDGCFDFVPHCRPRGYRRYVSPGALVRLVRHAKAIVACSFHGTAFSLIAGKPFVSLTIAEKSEKLRTRPGSLLTRLGCAGRLFSVREPVDEIAKELMKPVSVDVVGRLSVLRRSSYQALEKALGDISQTQQEFRHATITDRSRDNNVGCPSL